MRVNFKISEYDYFLGVFSERPPTPEPLQQAVHCTIPDKYGGYGHGAVHQPATRGSQGAGC